MTKEDAIQSAERLQYKGWDVTALESQAGLGWGLYAATHAGWMRYRHESERSALGAIAAGYVRKLP